MMRRSCSRLAPPSMPDMSKYFKWYPVGAGVFLGDMIAGHNAFIQDIPKKFDNAHAKHFAFVESMAIVPLFTLSMVHYFSIYCQYPSRVQQIVPLQNELGAKSKAIQFWLDQFAKKQAIESIPWRIGLLSLQLATFPFWLLVSSASPAVVHCTMERVNHIMASKYGCIDKQAPPFVAQHGKSTESAEDYHKQYQYCTTDFGVALVMLFLIWYLTM